MDDLQELRIMLNELLESAKEDLGSEKVQPYICILEGVLKGIDTDLESE